MAAFRDDMPLVAGVNENWDEDNTRAQIMRPDWDFSPIRMKTMHHLPQIFYDTLRPECPDCPVLIPSTFSWRETASYHMISTAMNHVVSRQETSCQPNWQKKRLMTASPVTLCTLIPAPDQVTPEEAYFRDLDFYKKTLFHTPFLSRGRAVTLLEYRDAQVIFEVDDWFNVDVTRSSKALSTAPTV